MESMLEKNFSAVHSELSDLEVADDRLEFFVEQAKSAPPLADELKTESFRVKGCISNLWIVPSYSNGRCRFLCDGDAVIPKGVALTVLEIFQGAEPAEIVTFDRSRLRALGVAEVLSPNRRNALSHVFDVVRQFALACANDEISSQQIAHG